MVGPNARAIAWSRLEVRYTESMGPATLTLAGPEKVLQYQ